MSVVHKGAITLFASAVSPAVKASEAISLLSPTNQRFPFFSDSYRGLPFITSSYSSELPSLRSPGISKETQNILF